MVSPSSLLLTLLIVILLFGTKKIRGMGEDIGAAVRGFHKGLQGDDVNENEKK